MIEFLKIYNNTIATGVFLILGVVFIVVMILSEWRRGEDWWRPKG